MTRLVGNWRQERAIVSETVAKSGRIASVELRTLVKRTLANWNKDIVFFS